jgi:serine/threonine-protein kinase
MLSGVLHGLHAAHEARSERGEPLNVVHRDISPQNVLVGIDGVARVLDFGIAKASGRTQWTKEGQVKGKLGYMAPEQIMGKVDRRTDVYAASVVLWEALAGKRLFFGENDPHVTKLVLEGRVDPASEHAPDVPPLLDAIVMRGLSREPADRFPTARDMALALEEAMPPVTASKIGAWVEATARMTLEDRTGRIAVIESDSSPEVPQATAVDAPTLLSNALMSSDAPASPVVRSNRTRLFWGAGSLALVLAAVFTYRRGTAEMPMAASAPPSTASSSAPPPQAAKVPEPAVLLASEAASVSAPIPAASTMARPTRRPLSKPPAVRNPRVDDGTSDRK